MGAALFLFRSVVGGVFMGLANLVPGISGGTMLLAVGIYPQFIGGVAEISTFRFRPPVILMLACVGGAAVVGVAGGAGLVSGALDRAPWAMYSLFIGLTLGGVPLLWRAVQPLDRTIVTSAAAAILVMAVLAQGGGEPAAGAGERAGATLLLVMAGAAGGAAMILPGVSGAYLLLLLGQYRTIIDAVAAAADGARAGDLGAAVAATAVLAPVAVGVAVGVIGVSNVVKMLLARYERATHGFLLGLLLGAVLGLWPFEDAGPPVWQLGAGAALAVAGFAISWGVSRFGNR